MILPDDNIQFWLWTIMVGSAVVGGLLSVWGTALQRARAATGEHNGAGHRLMLASYGFMTVSMLIFAVRGLI